MTAPVVFPEDSDNEDEEDERGDWAHDSDDDDIGTA